VLTRVQEELIVVLAQHTRNGRGLDELRPRTDHRQHPHVRTSLASSIGRA